MDMNMHAWNSWCFQLGFLKAESKQGFNLTYALRECSSEQEEEMHNKGGKRE